MTIRGGLRYRCGLLVLLAAASPMASHASDIEQPRRNRSPSASTPVSLFAGAEPTETARPAPAPLARWIALDGELKPTSIRAIVAVSKTSLAIISLTGEQVELPLTGPGRIVAVVPAQWWQRTATPGVGLDSPDEPVGTPQPSDAPGVLFCADGQRIPGFLVTSATLQPVRPNRPLGGGRPGAGAGQPDVGPRAPRPNGEAKPGGGGLSGPSAPSSPSNPTAPGSGDPTEPTGPATPPYSDEFRWMSAGLGEFTVKLEQAKRLVLIEGPRLGFGPRSAANELTRDGLSLVNGDRLEGFVAGMLLTGPGEATVKLEPEQGAPSIITVPRIRSIELATPPTASPAGASRLILRSGADLLVTGVSSAGNSLAIENTTLARATPPKLRVPFEQLVALLPEADAVTELAGTLAPGAFGPGALGLAPITPGTETKASPQPVGTLAPRPRLLTRAEPALLLAGEVELPGWCTASFLVPTGAARVAMQLVVPEACRDRAECTVTITLGGQVLSSTVLDAASPTAELNIQLPNPLAQATPLLVTLADGPKRSGPLQDRVIIRRPISVRSLR